MAAPSPVELVDDRIYKVSPHDLVPAPYNPREMSDEQMRSLAATLAEEGFLASILVNKRTGYIVSGHQRREAAILAGLKTVDVTYIDVEPAREMRINLAMNKHGGSFVPDMVRDVLKEIEAAGLDLSLTGFNNVEIDALMHHVPELNTEGEEEAARRKHEGKDPDAVVAEVPKRVRRGDVWRLGGHRLTCGDSTDPAVLLRLMDGDKADLVFTDIPFNVAGEGKNHAAGVREDYAELAAADWDQAFQFAPLGAALLQVMAPDVSLYMFTGTFLFGEVFAWAHGTPERAGWADTTNSITWCKSNPMPSLAKRHPTWGTELAVYATRGAHVFNFPDEGHALNWWQIPVAPHTHGHPTEKPVPVADRGIGYSSKPGDIVLDTCAGAGFVLIACEAIGRHARVVDQNPHWCDVMIARWETFTGHQAERLVEGDGPMADEEPGVHETAGTLAAAARAQRGDALPTDEGAAVQPAPAKKPRGNRRK